MNDTTAQEKKWEAESDARILATAEAIMADPERLKKAQTAAKAMVKDQKERQEEEQAITAALERLAQKRLRLAAYKSRYPKMQE